MENLVVERQRVESAFEANKLAVMRTLARFHRCDLETLCGRVDADEGAVHDILREMESRNELEVSSEESSGGARGATVALTFKGWGEYMKALGSIYELPE